MCQIHQQRSFPRSQILQRHDRYWGAWEIHRRATRQCGSASSEDIDAHCLAGIHQLHKCPSPGRVRMDVPE